MRPSGTIPTTAAKRYAVVIQLRGERIEVKLGADPGQPDVNGGGHERDQK